MSEGPITSSPLETARVHRGSLGHCSPRGPQGLAPPRFTRVSCVSVCVHVCVQITLDNGKRTGSDHSTGPTAKRPEDTQLSPRSRRNAPRSGVALAAPPQEVAGLAPLAPRCFLLEGEAWGHHHCTEKAGGSGEFEDGPQGWKQHLRSQCDQGAQTACGWVFSWRLLPKAHPVGSMPTVPPEP